MIVVAGHLTIDPSDRADYLEEAVAVVAAARRAPGCLDYAISADTVEADRINVFERWEDVESAEVFRADGPSGDQWDRIQTAEVSQYEVGSITSLT